MSTLNEKDQFYLNQTEPNKSCFLALRDIILKGHSSIYETRKYGMPCFCVQNKPVCYLWTDKKTKNPYLLFVDGHRLEHPRLESGKRAKMKIFRVDPNKDLPIRALNQVLSQALKLRELS